MFLSSDFPEITDKLALMREFINGRVIPSEPILHRNNDESRALMKVLQREAKDAGLWALGHPKEIGGGGVPFLPFVLFNEVIGRSQFGQVAVGSYSMQDSIMLHLFASPEQKKLYLEPLVRGEIRSSKGLTEPNTAGSDPTLYESSAELVGDEWVINAHKWFTTNANIARFTTMFVRTEGPKAPKHRSISAIIVPTDTPGYQVVRAVKTFGSDHGNHCEIRLKDARVPYSNLLGERGQGFLISQKLLGPGRIFHCMRWLGQAQRAFELMCARANVRFVHGSYLSEKGEIQRYVAESAADIQAARLLTMDAARVYDQGGDSRIPISIAKFYGAEMLNKVLNRAVQVHGALGVTEDTPLDNMFIEARFARFYDGPDEVHRFQVARRLLDEPMQAPWIAQPPRKTA